MPKLTIITGLLIGSLLASITCGYASQPENTVEIGGTLGKWDLSSGYMIIDGVRYRTVPHVNLVNSDGSTAGANSLQRNKAVLVRLIHDRIVQIVVLPDTPIAEPH